MAARKQGGVAPLVIIALLSLAAVAAALVSQHMFDMQPCPWCVLQRLIFLAIAGVSALALRLGRPLVRAGTVGIARTLRWAFQ